MNRLIFFIWISVFCFTTLFMNCGMGEAAQISKVWSCREITQEKLSAASFDVMDFLRDTDAWKVYDFSEKPPVSKKAGTVYLTTTMTAEHPEVNTLSFMTLNQSVRVWLDDQLIYE